MLTALILTYLKVTVYQQILTALTIILSHSVSTDIHCLCTFNVIMLKDTLLCIKIYPELIFLLLMLSQSVLKNTQCAHIIINDKLEQFKR